MITSYSLGQKINLKSFFFCSTIYLLSISIFSTFVEIPNVWGKERKKWASDFTVATEQSFKSIEVKSQGVASIDVSPDGKYLASAGHDSTLRIWKLENCELYKVVQLEPIDLSQYVGTQVLTTKFSPNGRWLAAGSYDGAIRLWEFDRTSVPQESIKLIGHKGPIWTTIFDSSGELLVSSSRDGTIKLWKPFESDKELATINAHKGTVYSIDLSPNEKTLVSGGEDHRVKLWDLETLKEMREIIAPGLVKSVRFAQNGNLIGGAIENTVSSPLMVWQSKTGRVLFRMGTDKDYFSTLAIHPTGKEVAAGGYGIEIWDLEKGVLRQTLTADFPDEKHQLFEGEFRNYSPRESPIRTLMYSRNGRSLFSGSYDFTPWLWDLKTGKVQRVFRDKGCKP